MSMPARSASSKSGTNCSSPWKSSSPEVAVADTILDEALPAVQDLADRKANAFVRRCGFAAEEREDVRSQLLLSFLLRWPKFDGARVRPHVRIAGHG
jgi:hypothetical protein